MSNVNFVSGANVTFVDFMLWELLDQMQHFDFQLLREFENLKSFKNRFSTLPKVDEYVNSARFMRAPVNSKRAKWGGDKELKQTWRF